MFAELRELLRSGAIRRHQFGAKQLLIPVSLGPNTFCPQYHDIDNNRYIEHKLIPFSTGGGNK